MAVTLAIVGRPNAGKSSLVNQVLGKTRSIVSDVPGTTRDALDIRCTVNGHDYILIDTAGIRRQAKIDAPVEIFSINNWWQRDHGEVLDTCIARHRSVV